MFKLSEPFICDQADSLLNWRPVFIARDPVEPRNEVDVLYSIADEVSRRELVLYKLWGGAKPLKKSLSQARLSLVHAHFGAEGVYASHIAEELSIPFLVTFHGRDATESLRSVVNTRRLAPLNLHLQHRRLDRAAKIICVSRYIASVLEQRRWVASEKLQVHYTGVDTAAIRPTGLPRQPVVIHVGRLVEKKGTADLIHAFSRLPRRLRDVRLDIVGDGPLKGQLTNLVESLRLNGRVNFLGPLARQEVLNHVASAEVFCLPSRTASNGDAEGLGMVALEAQALETPVILSNSGGLAEAAAPGVSGLYVKERDTVMLTDALVDLLDSDAKRRAMGEAGRKWVRANFDVNSQARALEELYDSCVS